MYSDYTPLTKYEILKRITQEEIYEIVVGYLPQANKYVTSPFRTDDKLAGAWYEWVNGILYFKDFAEINNKRHNRDCFQVVMEMKQLDYNKALIFIDEYFQLGIVLGNPSPILYELTDYSSKRNKGIYRSTRSEENNTAILTKSRQFLIYDKNYWQLRYGITKPNLIEDDVFALIWYKFFSRKQNEWITIRPYDICYCLAEFDNECKKIYRPLSINKWLTNCSENEIGNYYNLPIYGQKLLILKSYKDCRIARNFGIRNAVYFQSETMFPNDEVLLKLIKRFNEIIIWYDNDETGILGANKLMNKILELIPDKIVRLVFIEDKRIKDPGELYHKKGPKEVENQIKLIW